ncbi:GNAT family N-acetyltransferase [Roseibium sp. MB-4]
MHSLKSPRFLLRPPPADDLPVYQEFFFDRKASSFYGGPLRADQTWRVLAGHLGHWLLRDYGMWMISPREGGSAFGGCGFVWPEGWPRRELTWWLLPKARGQGVAIEASHAAIRHAYLSYGWPLVETHLDDDNIVARKLVSKLGGELIAREAFPDGKSRNVYRLPQLTQ